MNLGFTYGGVVESNLDPLKLGRLKVRVPVVYGATTDGAGYIGTNDLPWALPAGMPAGGSAKSGGFSQLPEVGDKVWVRFLDGEPEKPIWEWGAQSVGDGDALKLHAYDVGVPVGKPNRTIWTRYNHAIVMDEGSVIVTTSAGYRVVLTDASEPGTNDGNIMVTTPGGNFISFDDLDNTAKLNVVQDLYFNVGEAVTGISDSFSWKTLTGSFDISATDGFNTTAGGDITLKTASDIVMDAIGGITMTGVGPMVLGFQTCRLGVAAIQPAVLGTLMVAWMEALYVWLQSHTHVSGDAGTPTSPPTQPVTTIVPPPPAVLSTTVTIQN